MPIKFFLSSTELLSVAADVLVLGVPEGIHDEGGHPRGSLSKALGPAMAKAVKREEFTGQKDQTLDLSTSSTDLKPGRVLLVGLGKPEALTAPDVRVLAAKSARFALGAKATTLAIELPALAGAGAAERAAAEGVVLGAHRGSRASLTGDRVPKFAIERATLIASGKVGKDQKDAVALGQAVGEAVCIARDLINEPPNELTPEVLASRAADVAKKAGLEVTVLDKAALQKKGMKLILAVGGGSAHPSPGSVPMV